MLPLPEDTGCMTYERKIRLHAIQAENGHLLQHRIVRRLRSTGRGQMEALVH